MKKFKVQTYATAIFEYIVEARDETHVDEDFYAMISDDNWRLLDAHDETIDSIQEIKDRKE